MTMATIEAQPQKPQLSPPPPPHESTPVATVTTPTTKKEHIFRSRLSDIPISNHLPLHTYCFNKLPECADRPCLIVGSTGKIYTYAETHFLCRRTAAGLSKLGVKKGDVVMTLLQNCPEFVFSFFGASMIAAVSTTANPFYTPAEIFKQLAASKAKVIITHSQYVEKLRQSPDDINTSFPVFGKDFTVVTVDAPPENCLPFSVLSESNEADLPQVSIEPNDAVALPFSSGTTGLPKGVILTHRSLITGVAQNVDGENPNFYFNQDDVVLCLLPLFHIYSLSSVMLCSLRSGSRMVIMQKFEVGALLEQIQRHKVTVAAVVPPVVLMLAKNNEMAEKFDLSSIRAVLSGAAPLGKELEDAFRSRVPQAVLGQGYGMTEAGPVLSMCPGLAKDPLPNKPGSCGIIVRNAEMKVVHPETGCSLGYNQQGEICIRGHQVMKGYLNDSKATTAIIDEEGWLHTGDIGYVDDDGYVFIVDRIKEIIKYKGFQVAPAELEALLLNHPSIADAAVVPQKDEAAGEVPVAFVVPTKGFELSEEEVRQFIAKQVVFYKKLHKVYFVDSIAKSLAGKILRKELRAKLTS